MKDKDKVKENDKEESGAAEFGYIINVILDYYEIKGGSHKDDGESWKKGTEHDVSGVDLPEEVDAEIMKAFITQVKKFQ